ncbi:MAG: hypothetical protein CMF43_00435 [Legionellales bacterium]|nr:hypothetical protein [Legionellales bacterium]
MRSPMTNCQTCSCADHMVAASERKALLARSFALLSIGIAFHVHAIEHLLLSFLSPPLLMVLLAIPFTYTLYRDFAPTIQRLLNNKVLQEAVNYLMMYVALASLHGAVASSIIWASALMYTVFVIPFTLYRFALTAIHQYRKQGKDISFKQLILTTLTLEEMIPGSDVIILLSSLTTMLASAFMVFSPFTYTSELLVSDSFLTLGVYNMTRWFRSGWQSHELEHNHAQQVTYVRYDRGNPHINPVPENTLPKKSMREIRYADILRFAHNRPEDAVPVPVKAYAYPGTIIVDPQSETAVTLENGGELAPHTKLISGQVFCLEAYNDTIIDAKHHKTLHAQRSDLGTRLYLFTMLCVAVISSAYVAYNGGIILGVERLCMTLMIACPCVYMVIKPAVQARIPVLAKAFGFLMNTESLPLIGNRLTVVFDRTGTLWHPDTNDDHLQDNRTPSSSLDTKQSYSADYVIADSSKHMLKSLIARGIDVCILSGHSTHDYERHRRETVSMLSDLGLKDAERKVVFDSRCHGQSSIKSDYLNNIRQYGSMYAPTSIFEKMIAYVQSIFMPRSVVMVGDDLNDERAMMAADMSIAVGSLTQQSQQKQQGACVDDHCTQCNSFTRQLFQHTNTQTTRSPDVNYKSLQQGVNQRNKTVATTRLVYNDRISRFAAFVTSPRGIGNLAKLLPILYRSSLCVQILTALSVFVGISLMAIVCGINPLGLPVNAHTICGISSMFCLYMTALSRAKIIDYFIDLHIDGGKWYTQLVNHVYDRIMDLPLVGFMIRISNLAVHDNSLRDDRLSEKSYFLRGAKSLSGGKSVNKSTTDHDVAGHAASVDLPNDTFNCLGG